MEQQRTQRTTQQPADAGPETPPPDGSNLVQQARGYADVARRARENCQKGHAAEEELRKRRNRSGQ